MIRVILAILFAIFTSCNSETKKDVAESDIAPKEDVKTTKSSILGKYIYRDDNYVIHAHDWCFIIRPRVSIETGHEIYAKHLIDTADFVITDPERFRVCEFCVDDNNYSHLIEISKRNSGSRIAIDWE